MDLIGTDEYESETIRAVARALMLDEEYQSFEGTPSPAALVGRCFYRLTQAALRIGGIEGHIKEGEHEYPWLTAGVEFAWVATLAIAAGARIGPDTRDSEPVRAKASLLAELDRGVAAWPDRPRAELTPGYWLATVAAVFGGAAEGVGELEGCPARSTGAWWPDLVDEDDDGADPDEIAATVARSLMAAAVAATKAAEWFFRHRERGES